METTRLPGADHVTLAGDVSSGMEGMNSSQTRSQEDLAERLLQLNQGIAAVLTCWTPINLLILATLISCCPLRDSFNIFALFICIADVLTCSIWGPISLAALINPAFLSAQFCQARGFIRTVTFSITLATSVNVGFLRLLSAINTSLFKKFLHTRYMSWFNISIKYILEVSTDQVEPYSMTIKVNVIVN